MVSTDGASLSLAYLQAERWPAQCLPPIQRYSQEGPSLRGCLMGPRKPFPRPLTECEDMGVPANASWAFLFVKPPDMSDPGQPFRSGTVAPT
jgi:hypothetical protein